MNIRSYKHEDYEQVRALLLSQEFEYVPRAFDETGFVLVENEHVVGFAWALQNKESEMACVEYFAVFPGFRGNGAPAMMLMNALLLSLYANGKTRITAFLNREASEFGPLIRLYHQHGVMVHAGVMMTSDVRQLATKISEGLKGRNADG